MAIMMMRIYTVQNPASLTASEAGISASPLHFDPEMNLKPNNTATDSMQRGVFFN